MRTNVRIVQEYIEQVFNQKRIDRLSEFCSEDCVLHSPPYVGLGLSFEEASEGKIILTRVAPNAPSFHQLQIGDELIRVENGDRAWETPEEIRNGLWTRGQMGVEVRLTVRRHGNLLTIPLRFDRIDQFDTKLSEYQQVFIHYLQKYWPDIRMEIQQIFGEDDRVAVYTLNHGTNLEYNRSAIWGEMDIFRLKDGRITDVWYVEANLDELKQLGYQIREPARERVQSDAGTGGGSD